MKILWLNWRDIKNPQAGGAEVMTHETAKGLSGIRHLSLNLTKRIVWTRNGRGCRLRFADSYNSRRNNCQKWPKHILVFN